MGNKRKKLGVVSVALITYFNVSGGPWGSEPIIAACGPLIGILATLVFPFVWCLPLALSFAEMFSAFPTDSSFCTWVGKAFGRPMGFYIGYWSWIGGVIDNAIYPCLMVDSIHAVLVGPDAVVKSFVIPMWMYAIRLFAATVFMLPTIYSIDAVGRFLLILGIVMIFPFIVLVVTSIPQILPSNWLQVRSEPQWSRLLSVLYWSYSGFDAAGAYAGVIDNPQRTYPHAMIATVVLILPSNWLQVRSEPQWSRLLSVLYWSYSGFDAAGAYTGVIDNPQRTYPHAMIATVVLVSLTYSIPFLAASGVNKPPYELWSDGFYPIIAEYIAGPGLRSWFLLCAILGNMGVYIAKMTKNGFQLAGMADLGLAPTVDLCTHMYLIADVDVRPKMVFQFERFLQHMASFPLWLFLTLT
ncbi:hypothetical protein ABG067_005272 [Albugo candida]